LEKEVASLKKENAFLKERLAKYENSKYNRNNFLPSSNEENLLKTNLKFTLVFKEKCRRSKDIRGLDDDRNSRENSRITAGLLQRLWCVFAR